MTTMLLRINSTCFSIFIISVVIVSSSLLFVVNEVEARTVKSRSFAPAIYRHNNNIDDFTTRLSYNTNNNNHHHKHDQPSSSSSSTLDILFCSHNNDKSLDDYELIIRAESEKLGHILQLSSVLDLIPASLQPMMSNNLLLPNSQRLFQVLPSVRERVSSSTTSKNNKNNNNNNNKNSDCLLIEVPLWESFACSVFIARATELVTGSRKAAAELLVKELMILNNISSSSSSSSVSVSMIIDSLEEHQNHRVVLNDPSYTTSRAQARDAMVRSFHDRRDELDRAAALVYSALSKPKPKSSHSTTRKADFSFELISNGKYSNCSLSLDFATEKHTKNKNNNDNNDNEEEIEIHTSIEQTSELSAIMTVDIARSNNNNHQHGDDTDDKKLSSCEVLVRLPPHIAQLDYRYLVTTTSDNDDDDDGRRAPILTFKHDDGDDDDNNKIRIFPLSQQHQHQHQQVHHHHHQHHHVDRHWKSYWFVSPSSSSSFTIPLRIPRLPVEAYPPDLNRLVTLPAVVGRCVGTETTTTRKSDDNEINHRPPTETSIEALGVLSRSLTSSSSYHRSINRVSLYQPGPDRAIPFVVLAFAMLVTSVLVIRTVSVVAVASSGGVIEKTK